MLKLASRLAAAVSILGGAVAIPGEPGAPLGHKGELVFEDAFDRPEIGPAWKTGIPAYAIADGALHGWQERDDHRSSIGAKVPLPDGNAHLELRFRFDGASSLNVNLDDKSCQEVHAGHISRVVIRQNKVFLYDDREGVMRNDIRALRQSDNPEAKERGNRLAEGRTKIIPFEIENGRWYRLGLEIVGDQMRVTIDGREIGRLQSSGLAHPNKSDLRIGVWGKSARVDDLKIWSVARAGGVSQ